jgi:hypothetical protein
LHYQERKRRPKWGFFNTAAPNGASVLGAGGMMPLPRIRISKPATYYLAGVPPSTSAGAITAETHHTPGFRRDLEWWLVLAP